MKLEGWGVDTFLVLGMVVLAAAVDVLYTSVTRVHSRLGLRKERHGCYLRRTEHYHITSRYPPPFSLMYISSCLYTRLFL